MAKAINCRAFPAPRYRGAMIDTTLPVTTILQNLAVLNSWGANLVRWQLINNPKVTPGWSYDQYLTWLNGALACFDACLPTLKASGIFVVLDMHHPIGGTDNQNKWRLFNDPSLQAQFVQIWQSIATRYAKESQIVAFDIFNEPIPYKKNQWPPLALQTCRALRKIVPKLPLVVETIGASISQFLYFKPLPQLENIWYSAHVYQPSVICNQGVPLGGPVIPIGAPLTKQHITRLHKLLGALVKFQQKYGSTMYIGEFGCAR